MMAARLNGLEYGYSIVLKNKAFIYSALEAD